MKDNSILFKGNIKREFTQPLFEKKMVEVEGFCVTSGKPVKAKGDVKVEEYVEVNVGITFE